MSKNSKEIVKFNGRWRNKSATLPYLPIENVKCVRMYESGNFVRIIKRRCCKSSCKIEEIVNQ